LFQENLKHFGIFFKKESIVWILQQVCKIPKDFGLYLKIIFGKKILFTFNTRIKNLQEVNIQNIIRDNNFITHFNIRIKNFYEVNIQNIIVNNATHSF
jgi:hypothetical protein